MLLRVRRPPGLSWAQRIVLVVALAATLVVIGLYLTTIGAGSAADFGWFGYAPLTPNSPLDGGGPPAWARLLIWLALIAVWAGLSLRLLRPGRGKSRVRP
jgi:hypothetical protein